MADEPFNRSVTIRKEGHTYIFRFKKGDEIAVFYRMMEMAIDDEFNLTVRDLVHLTSKALKQAKPNFEVDLDKQKHTPW